MKPSQWLMETQPSEESLNNARRILAQIEGLRSATRVPTLRKMWTDGTTNYEFVVSEGHSRIRVWGEDETFNGFLFTYPEDGFWGVGYRKEKPKYKKKPKTPLAGEIDWQGFGGKLTWKGLSRYFAYSNGGTWGIPGQYTVGAEESFGTYLLADGVVNVPKGHRYDLFDLNTPLAELSPVTGIGGPDVYMGGKRLCSAAPAEGANIIVTCAAISPDKKKMLLGYAATVSGKTRETFLMLPFPPPPSVNPQTPGVIVEVSRVQDNDVGVPYSYASTFTTAEAEYLWPNWEGPWRINASGTLGHSERRATRQRLNIVWTTDAEEITITAEAAAWVRNDKNVRGVPVTYSVILDASRVYASDATRRFGGTDVLVSTIMSTWEDRTEAYLDTGEELLPGYKVYVGDVYPPPSKRGESFEVSFCDFDWDTLVEGRIVVDSTTTQVVDYSTYKPEPGDGSGMSPTSILTTKQTVAIAIDGVMVHQRSLDRVDTYTAFISSSSPFRRPPNSPGSVTTQDGTWLLNVDVVGAFTFFHWVDLRIRGLSVDTHSGTDGSVDTLENWTYINYVRVVTLPPVYGSYIISAARYEFLPSNIEDPDTQTLRTYTHNGFIITQAPQPLPYGVVLPSNNMGGDFDRAGYIQNIYVHHTGLGVAETGIKVYYLSPTEKRCVWGIANLPSAHLNELQTYTYGSDDEATAAELKGVGADGLLLNIYII